MLVFDASTLILLSKVELLPLFCSTYGGRICVPRGVADEVFRKESHELPLIRALMDEGRIEVEEVRKPQQVVRLMKDFGLDRGEAEAVVLALEKGAQAVATDDGQAIKACKLLKLPFVTAIALLLRAREKGLLGKEQALLKLEKLSEVGRYSARIIQDARLRIEGGG